MNIFNRKWSLLLFACAGATVAVAACQGSSGDSSSAGGPGTPPDTTSDGVWETDTSPSMQLSVPGAPPGHSLRADRIDALGHRAIFHSDGQSTVAADFMPPGFVLYPIAAHGGGTTIVCGVSGPALNVATNDYTGVAGACAVRTAAGFASRVATGTWIFELCADAPRGGAPNGSFDVLYVEHDGPFRLPDDAAPHCQKVTWDGNAWSSASPSQCHCAQREGQPCKNPCFREPGARAANGTCALPAARTSACPMGQYCTGDATNLCVPQQIARVTSQPTRALP